MTRNITLAVDEDLLKKAKIVAAQRGKSLNALVRDCLLELTASDDRAELARRRLLELIDESTGDMGPDDKLNHDALYEHRGFH